MKNLLKTRLFLLFVLFASLVSSAQAGYDSTIGRWLSRDPIGEDGGLNLYGYVNGNVVNSIDPTGYDTLVIINHSTFPTWSGEIGLTSSGNPLGHAAIAITGSGLFSFGNNPNANSVNYVGSDVVSYMKDQSKRRDSTLYFIHTTLEQEQVMLEYLQSVANTRINALTDNCADRVASALSKAGYNLDIPKSYGEGIGYIGFPGNPIDLAFSLVLNHVFSSRADWPQGSPPPRRYLTPFNATK
jgi:hypothetical protein